MPRKENLGKSRQFVVISKNRATRVGFLYLRAPTKNWFLEGIKQSHWNFPQMLDSSESPTPGFHCPVYIQASTILIRGASFSILDNSLELRSFKHRWSEFLMFKHFWAFAHYMDLVISKKWLKSQLRTWKALGKLNYEAKFHVPRISGSFNIGNLELATTEESTWFCTFAYFWVL